MVLLASGVCVCVCVSGAGRPPFHLCGELQDEADVGPLIGIWVDTHADQISELKHKQGVWFTKDSILPYYIAAGKQYVTSEVVCLNSKDS